MIYFMSFISILGIFEIISNIFHLSKGSIDKIGQSAKRQHQELPLNIKDIHFFIKAIIMLIFGIMFLIIGIIYFSSKEHNSFFSIFLLGLFGLYGILQAVLYRKTLNVWLSAIVYNIPILVYYIAL